MSYGDSFLSGFNTSFGTVQGARDRKEEQRRFEERKKQMDERRLVEDARYEAAMARQAERDLVSDTRYAEDQRRTDERRLVEDARADRAFDFQKSRATTADLADMMDRSRQARIDFGNEVRAAEEDPVRNAILVEQARALQLQNDAFGQPKPVTPTETLTWENGLDGDPVRRVSGPLGSLGAVFAPEKSFSKIDADAYQWAIQNPKDPRSAQILSRLGLAR